MYDHIRLLTSESYLSNLRYYFSQTRSASERVATRNVRTGNGSDRGICHFAFHC